MCIRDRFQIAAGTGDTGIADHAVQTLSLIHIYKILDKLLAIVQPYNSRTNARGLAHKALIL